LLDLAGVTERHATAVRPGTHRFYLPFETNRTHISHEAMELKAKRASYLLRWLRDGQAKPTIDSGNSK